MSIPRAGPSSHLAHWPYNMIAAIARQLSVALKSAVAAGGTEPNIIRAFISGASSISTSPRFLIESIFVHQRPYAYFVSPSSVCGKSRTELGDILFLVKRIKGGVVSDYRFTFAQAKKLHSDVALIAVHQFLFYRDISSLSFNFGNAVYKRTQSTPLTWSGLTKSTWFGHYLLLDSPFSLSARTTLIDTHYPGGCSPFAFAPPFPWDLPWPNLYLGLLPFESFLLCFLQLGGLGVRVSSATSSFLDIVLKRVGWVLDPPAETAGYFENDPKGGFGIIRVTIKEDERD